MPNNVQDLKQGSADTNRQGNGQARPPCCASLPKAILCALFLGERATDTVALASQRGFMAQMLLLNQAGVRVLELFSTLHWL